MKTQILKIADLEPGDTFECPGLKDGFRDGVLIRQGTAGSFADFEEFDGYAWKRHRSLLSSNSRVQCTGHVDLRANEKGLLIPIRNRNPSSENTMVRVEEVKGNESNKKRRKRNKSSQDFEFPDGEFTVKEIAVLNNCKPYEVHNSLKNLIESRKVKFVRFQSFGRGKPSGVFKAVK